MTPQIALTLAITVGAVVLFASEKLRVDVIALMVLLTVGLTGLVPLDDVFAGFASPAVITVWAVYMVSGGLFRTGVADVLGERIAFMGGTSERRLIIVIMLMCGTMSAFMNNIGATAVLLPAVIGIARQTKIPASRLLIPLSFASLLGGNMTLIGTPPNILAAGILDAYGLDSFGFFAYTPTGIIVFATGIVFMATLGRRLLPVRPAPDEQWTSNQFRQYVTEVRVLPESRLDATTLSDSRLGADFDLTVVALAREGQETETALRSDTVLKAGDLLLLKGRVENIMRARDELGLAMEAEHKADLAQLEPEKAHMVEATLAPGSRMIGRSLRDMRFRDRFGFTVLAVWRHGGLITERLRDVRLRFGDALLLQGPQRRLRDVAEGEDFLLLEPVRVETRHRRKAPLAVGITGLVLFLATVAGQPIAVALVIGSLLMVLTGCLTMDEAYQSVEWRSVFLIAGMLPLGLAMEQTGTATFLANLIVESVGSYGALATLAGIYVLASLITEPMSNAAATVLMVPIAIDTALQLGASPQAFVLATVIGASTSFLTPIGHQANVLVYGPGGYRFTDYTRVGAPLNVAIFVATMLALPLLWPLFP